MTELEQIHNLVAAFEGPLWIRTKFPCLFCDTGVTTTVKADDLNREDADLWLSRQAAQRCTCMHSVTWKISHRGTRRVQLRRAWDSRWTTRNVPKWLEPEFADREQAHSALLWDHLTEGQRTSGRWLA